jgi:FHA domain
MVSRLYERSDVMQRPPRLPRQQRNRRRWAVVAGIAALWAFFAYSAGSLIAGTILMVLIAVAVILLAVALRCLGIDRDHPWLRRLAAQQRRDVADPAVQPGGYLPESDMPEPDRSAGPPQPADSFFAQAHGGGAYADPARSDWAYGVPAAADPARFDRAYPAPAAADPARFDRAYPAPAPADPARFDPSYAAPAAHDPARLDPAAARTVVSDFATVVALNPVPPLRLVTNGTVTETRVSGARAGRAREAELRLPEEPTVSRAHAEFTFSDGQWHITNLGLNGATLNGTPVTGQHAISDGDSIGWGTQPSALVSRVEIGRDMPRKATGQR